MLKAVGNFFTRLYDAIIKVPKEKRKEFSDKRLAANTGRMFVLAVYIIILQIALNIINILKPSDGDATNIGLYIALSMGTLLMGVVYTVLLLLVRKKRIRNKILNRILCESILYLYVAIQLVFCTFNIISDGGFNSFVIAVMIICVVPIVNPIQSGLTIISSFVYIMVISFALRDTAGAWDSIMLTDTWTNLIIIAGVALIGACIQYYMYVSNYHKSINLETSNTVLEETVTARTHELEEQTLAAITASKAKSDFLAKMSHEIRTPLNAIIGMSQIIKKEEMTPKALNGVEEIMSASGHLLDVINDILDMSKIESGKFELTNEPFILKEALVEIKKFMRPRAETKKLNFDFEYDNFPDIEVVGDKLRLKQVILNLANNAFKFTADGGTVTIKTSITKNNGIEMFNCSVTDNGIGMSEEQQKRLFRPFEQADASIAAHYGGTGLGLVISKSFVEKMGGSISLKSALGEGATFEINLPVVRSQTEVATQDESNVRVPNLIGRRILIVEDIEINRIVLEGLLEETKVIIETAEHGGQAVEMFKNSTELYYDLIFMDIQMPILNGYEATEQIRALDRMDAKTVPIVAMTANAYKDDIEACLKSGMNAHLAKPVEPDSIMATLNKYIA